MATWTNATITNKGYALQAKLLSTDKLEITRVVAGSGRASAGQLVNQTAVSDIKQTLTVESMTYDDKGNAKLRVLLSNRELTASYVCNQIGIYANDPDEGEILYAIVQEAVAGQSIPSIVEQPYGYDCGWQFVLTFSNSENVSVTIDPANTLTVEAGDERYSPLSKEVLVVNCTFEYGTFKATSDADKTADDIFEAVSSGRNVYLRAVEADGNTVLLLPLIEITKSSAVFGGHLMSFMPMFVTADVNSKGDVYMNYMFNGSSLETDGTNVGTNVGLGNNRARGMYSVASGEQTEAKGTAAFSSGCETVANDYQFVAGKNNSEKVGAADPDDQSNNNSIFIVGYGTSETPANAMRITAAGRCMGVQAFLSSGADFAEYFEWLDGNPNNEDRRGRFVTLDGKKIRFANADDDYILGAVSAKGAFIGNSSSENWHRMYLTDVYGEPLTEQVDIPERVDEKTGRKIEAHTITRFVVNPEYNPEQEYTSREFRKEWSPVGFHGQIVVVDDGTCEVNSYCKPSIDGIATASENGFRVMSRLDDTHIEVLIR